ncbi:MAG: class I SAM-dependent methyltransferase [bacterium]|jgi:SAM-dependent methyltransferase
MDEIARRNRGHWERLVRDGLIYTKPWLDLDPALVKDFASGRLDEMSHPYKYIYPREVFEDVEGKQVLCLAASGGQQSAIFGLLGAHVTVLDLTRGQLDGDRAAAEHYGYNLKTVLGDMRDLTVLKEAGFDLVYQAISIIFVPSVREVYSEVHRVLRPGGLYRVGHCNPAVQAVEFSSWDGQGYRIEKRYRERVVEDAESLEFRHYFSEIFNHLIDTGFEIRGVWEDPRHFGYSGSEPGSEDHCLEYVQGLFAVLARKADR